MTAFDIDRAIDALARKQHGAFHRDQAIARGATRRMIQRRVETGRWLQLDRHVYALPSVPPTWLRQVKAAELSVPGSALSGKGAGALFGLDGVRVGRLEVTAPRGGHRTSRLARVRHRDGIRTVVRESVRVVELGRTILDLAGLLDIGGLERALDDALVRRLTTVESLVAHLEPGRTDRQPGRARLSQLLDDRLTGYVPPANVLEAGLHALFMQAGLPPFVAQSAFPWWPDAPYRCDVFVPTWRRIVEADGRLWHARFRDFERDRARDHVAQAHGYEVTRFTYRQIVDDPTYAREVLLAIGRHAAAA